MLKTYLTMNNTNTISNTINPFIYGDPNVLADILVSCMDFNSEEVKHIKTARENISILDKSLPLPKKSDKKIEI